MIVFYFWNDFEKIHGMDIYANPAKLITFGLFLLFSLVISVAHAQLQGCTASLDQDTLKIGNSKIEQKWLWNGGHLKVFSIKDVTSGKIIVFEHALPSFDPGSIPVQGDADLKIKTVDKNLFSPAHLEVELISRYQSLLLKRVFSIFPATAAVSCDYYLKYESLFPQTGDATQKTDGIEKGLNSSDPGKGRYIGAYRFNSGHWRIRSVAFRDVTDRQDNLVHEQMIIPYRPEMLEGNLLFAKDLVNGNNFFILKEAPNGRSQLNYPGYDFFCIEQGDHDPFFRVPHYIRCRGMDQWLYDHNRHRWQGWM